MEIKGKKSKKEIVILAAAIILSISALVGAVFYFIQSTAPQTSPPAIVPPQVAAESGSKTTPASGQQQDTLTVQPSPFASTPTGNASSGSGTSPGMPEMPPMPPITPILSPDNTPPPFGGNKIQVNGIVIGAVKTAVLSNGQNQITVKEGSECQWGMVTSITKSGVVLDGQYIAMNRQPDKQ